jgi:drug/metabolite transporter (DMT)-like permease
VLRLNTYLRKNCSSFDANNAADAGRHITTMADPPLYAALLLIQLNFAIGAVVAALALPKTEPLTFALIREVCAACLLTVYAVQQGAPAAPPRGSRALMARLGACACATQVLAIVGLKLSADPTAFALWQPAQPVAVAGVSILLRWDRPDAGRVTGVVLAAIGCFVATTTGTGGAGLAAHGCFAAAAAAGAAYQLVSKPATRRHAPIAVAAWAYSYAAVGTALSAAALWACGVSLCAECSSFYAVPLEAWPALAWWIICSTCVNYALMMWCVKRSSPTLVSAASALQPPLAAVCALIVIALTGGAAACGVGDGRCVAAPTVRDGAAALLIVCGVLAVARSETSATTASPPAEYVRVPVEGGA